MGYSIRDLPRMWGTADGRWEIGRGIGVATLARAEAGGILVAADCTAAHNARRRCRILGKDHCHALRCRGPGRA